MRLYVIGTGSSGNAYLLARDDGRALLLDAGVNIKRIEQAIYTSRLHVEACLVTHEHGDHAKAVRDLTKLGIKCYGTPGTASVVHGVIPFPLHSVKLFAGFLVMPVPVNHDAIEPCAFLFTDPDTMEKMIYATDTYFLTNKYPGLNYWLIECNYCEEMLTEDTPPILAKRLSTSHMSLKRLCDVFRANDLSRCRKIILCHISHDRGDPEMMRRRIRDQTGKNVEIARAGTAHELALNPF